MSSCTLEQHRLLFCFCRVVPIISAGKTQQIVYQHTEQMQRVFEVKNSGGTTMTVIISLVLAHLHVCCTDRRYRLTFVWASARFRRTLFSSGFTHAVPIKIGEMQNLCRHSAKSSRHTVASPKKETITTPSAFVSILHVFPELIASPLYAPI